MHNTIKTQQWDAGTRFLHLGLAITVSVQLLSSLILEMPKPSRPLTGFDALVFESHEWLGMTALAIVLLHWGWSLWANGGYGIRHLLPWNRAGRTGVMQDFTAIKKLDTPTGGPKAKLAGLIHGLGLLAVTVMALTGAALFIWMPENGRMTPVTGLAKEAHEFMSTFVWIYWGGHVAMGMLHHFKGHDTLRTMFNLKRAETRKMPHAEGKFI
ncbi:MAG: cytochrome b/b6 domain-containing protein [Gammaproteobacteria bacterium]